MCHCMEVASRALLSSGRAQSLVAKGVGFGALHVLAGPDHLSALATLSVGSSYRAFSVGIRWVCPHISPPPCYMVAVRLRMRRGSDIPLV